MNIEDMYGILKELHPEINFETHFALIDDSVLDSFDIVTIVAEIDDVFDVSVPPEEIVPENFNSAKSLFEMVVRLAGE